MDHRPPGSSAQGILQARIMEWAAMPSSRGPSWPRGWTRVFYVSCLGWWALHRSHHMGSPNVSYQCLLEREKTDVQHKSLWDTENTSTLNVGVLETTAWLCINVFWFDSPQERLKIWLASWIVIFFNMTLTNISCLFLLEIEKEYLETKIWNSNIGNTKKLSLLDLNSEYRNKCLYSQK